MEASVAWARKSVVPQAAGPVQWWESHCGMSPEVSPPQWRREECMAGLDTCDAHSCCPWRPHSRNRHRMGNSGKNTNLGPSSLFRKERSLGRWQDKSASHCLQGDASGGLGWSPGEGSLPFPGSPAVSPSPPWGDRLRMAVWLRWPPSSRGQHEQGSTGLELWVLSCIC